MSPYSVLIAARTSAGRLPIVFERLEGEVNLVVTEMALEGRSGEYSSRPLSRGGGLGVRASVRRRYWISIAGQGTSAVQTSERNGFVSAPQ
jgi:hypothetical protein